METPPLLIRFLIVFFALLLTACASTGGGTAKIKERINTGQTGAIIAALDETTEVNGVRKPAFLTGWINIQNTETKAVTRYYLDRNREPTSAKSLSVWLSITELPAGTYRILSGKAQIGQGLQTLPLINLWFKPIEVRPGHITNLGMLQIQNIVVDTRDQDLNFMEVLSGREDENFTTYVTYNITDIPPSVLTSSLEDWADYKGVKVVEQPLKLRLSDTEFKQAVKEASTPDVNGEVPNRGQVSNKLRLSLLKMLIGTSP